MRGVYVGAREGELIGVSVDYWQDRKLRAQAWRHLRRLNARRTRKLWAMHRARQKRAMQPETLKVAV